MYEQCKTCIKEDVCPKAYYHGAFGDRPCEKHILGTQLILGVGDTAYFVKMKPNVNVVEYKIAEMRINSRGTVRYRYQCSDEYVYGITVFRTFEEATQAAEAIKSERKKKCHD